VEDSETDALLIKHALERGGFDVTCRRVERKESMQQALGEGQWDLVLADHSMPEFSAPEALQVLREGGLDLPFIIVSGHIDEETAIAAMRSGAHDYVTKERLGRLLPAVERELREAETRRVRREYAEELQRAREELEARVEKRTADLKAANRKLERMIEERRRLESELLEIAEKERRRIGFDLHDDLGQKLTGVCLMMKGLGQKLSSEQHPCASDAQRIQVLIDEIILHTHNLAHQFSSMDLRGEDLSAVLREMAGNLRRMFDISCALAIKGEVPPLPANTALQLHKIAQEAVSNAIKHGNAKHVWIGLTREPASLVLSIRNDGLPFVKPEGTNNRMGLRIMNYRANTIGASLEIKPGERNGTIVTCALPVKAPPRSRRAEARAEEAEECCTGTG
jgi:signal transduction histidine kinase